MNIIKIFIAIFLFIKGGIKMTRAFTEEEKLEIKKKIMETALDLFHDKGTKSLSIAELTRRVGIGQGTFYNFWQDKESLIIDLVAYRSIQKLSIIENDFSQSLANPVEFLSQVIYKYSLDLMIKIKTQAIYNNAFKILKKDKLSEVSRIEKLYGGFLHRLVDYWRENSAIKSADEVGLANAFIGSFLLCSEYYHFDEIYFEEVLETFIISVVTRYIDL